MADPRDFLRKIVRDAEGDDYERAKLSFGRMTDEQLDQPYSHSGKTCRAVLQEYADARNEWAQASMFLETLIHLEADEMVRQLRD